MDYIVHGVAESDRTEGLFFFFYDSLSLKNKIPIFHKVVPIEPIPLWDIQLNAVHILGYTLSCCLLNRFQTG